MKTSLLVFLLAAVLALFVQYRLRVVVGSSPVAVSLPDLPALPTSQQKLQTIERIGENDLVGPESLVVSKGYMFAALGDGRIVRLKERNQNMEWTTLVRTGGSGLDDICSPWSGPSDLRNIESICGRPLGLIHVNRSSVDQKYQGDDAEEEVLIVADSYKGLLMVTGIFGAKPQIQVLATKVTGETDQLTLLNSVVQTPDGSLYVSQTSQHFERRRIFQAALDGRSTGRLLRYNPTKGSFDVVLDSLFMPNGLALSHEKTDILIVCGVQILKYSLEKGFKQPFVDVMMGTGDNVKSHTHLPTGQQQLCYWVGYGSKYAKPFNLLYMLADKPWIKGVVQALVPHSILIKLIPKFTAFGVYDENGLLLKLFRDPDGSFPWISEVEPMGDWLYFASWYNPYLGRMRMRDLV